MWVRYGLAYETGAVESVGGGMARVWYRAVSVLLIRRRRPIGEPATPRPEDSPAPVLPAGATTHAGIGGAGRIVQSLTELGISFDAVQQLVLDVDTPPAAIGAIDVDERFPIVILGSHLVNLPDDATRRSFLGIAVRHLAPGGTLLVEHHPLDWAETAAETRATPGGSLGMVDVRRDPPFVSATSVYDVGGRIVRQPFTARVLSESELAAELATCGFGVRRRPAPTWLEAAER